MKHFYCVNHAGAYPFALPGSSHARWLLMEQHASLLRSSPVISAPLFEQDMLPPFSLPREATPRLRLVLCGRLWYGEHAYGHSIESLVELQGLLDSTTAACLASCTGDFSLAYLSPDGTVLRFYRSLTGTRGLYYRITTTSVRWATNPADLFPAGQPHLDDIDAEMVAILAATGQADPQRTCYQQVSCVPAGDCLCFRQDGSRSMVHNDYERREDNTHLPFSLAARRLREQIEAAVGRVVRDEASLHLLLSGGLDTSVVAYEAARHGKGLHGYHWTWGKRLFDEEDQAAQAVAEQLEIDLHTLDFQETCAGSGEYLRSMSGLIFPYNHPFYACFARTIATIGTNDTSSQPRFLLGGHLGDALFQGDWADGFRLLPGEHWKPLQLLGQVLAWYPRREAFAAWGYLLARSQRDLELNPNAPRIEAYQPLFSSQAFAQVQANGNLDYRERYAPTWGDVGARTVRASLQSSLDFNASLGTALGSRDGLAHGVALRHPFADRALQEFCLSLGPQHRTRQYAGLNFSKFLMRFAYVGDLPPRVIRAEFRSAYASISERYCLQNRQELREIFSAESQLARLGILKSEVVQEILSDAEQCQKHSRSLVRMAGVEIWLRGLAQQPLSSLDNPLELGQAQTHCAGEKPPIQETGVLALKQEVQARLIHTSVILANTRTLEVCRLDEDAVHYWQALCSQSTWPQVFTFLQRQYPEEPEGEIRASVCSFARMLVNQGWAAIRTPEEGENDGICTHNFDRLRPSEELIHSAREGHPGSVG